MLQPVQNNPNLTQTSVPGDTYTNSELKMRRAMRQTAGKLDNVFLTLPRQIIPEAVYR